MMINSNVAAPVTSLTVGSTRTPTLAMPSASSWPVLVPFALRAPAPVNLGVRPLTGEYVSAYAVKHLVADHGPLSSIMKDVKKTPYSYTSKELEATAASRGLDVYVVQVEAHGSERAYALGYKYRATEKYAPAGGGLWKGEFKYKNSATPGTKAVGLYFEPPLPIANATVRQWLAEKQPGMAEIPAAVLKELEALVVASSSLAVSF